MPSSTLSHAGLALLSLALLASASALGVTAAPATGATTTSATGATTTSATGAATTSAGDATTAEAKVAFEQSVVTVRQGEAATLTVLFAGDVSGARLGVVGPDGENQTRVRVVDANDDGEVRVRVDTATTGDEFLAVVGDDTAQFASLGGDSADTPPFAPGRYELSLSRDSERRDVGVLIVEGESTPSTPAADSATTSAATATATASTGATGTAVASNVDIPGFGPVVAAAALALGSLLASRVGRDGRR